MEDDPCLKRLTYLVLKDRKKENNFEIDIENHVYSETYLFEFARGWIKKIEPDPKEKNLFENFIYLWVTFNAWLSQAVSGDPDNQSDTYLIHAIAASDRHDDNFERLRYENKEFKLCSDSLAKLGPIFKVSWLRSKNQDPWNQSEERSNYIKRIRSLDPYSKNQKPKFSPACAFEEHLDQGLPIPADWLHTIHMIYQIRCNIFHGGKIYDSRCDREFVRLAFKVLWEMFKKENFVVRILREE